MTSTSPTIYPFQWLDAHPRIRRALRAGALVMVVLCAVGIVVTVSEEGFGRAALRGCLALGLFSVLAIWVEGRPAKLLSTLVFFSTAGGSLLLDWLPRPEADHTSRHVRMGHANRSQ